MRHVQWQYGVGADWDNYPDDVNQALQAAYDRFLHAGGDAEVEVDKKCDVGIATHQRTAVHVEQACGSLPDPARQTASMLTGCLTRVSKESPS